MRKNGKLGWLDSLLLQHFEGQFRLHLAKHCGQIKRESKPGREGGKGEGGRGGGRRLTRCCWMCDRNPCSPKGNERDTKLRACHSSSSSGGDVVRVGVSVLVKHVRQR